MATKKKAGQEKEAGGEDVLQKAAKVIGSALGTIAKKTGIAETPPKKSGKLVRKDKKRLPRREKKRAQKATLAKTPNG
jgi:hypothetical protein